MKIVDIGGICQILDKIGLKKCCEEVVERVEGVV